MCQSGAGGHGGGEDQEQGHGGGEGEARAAKEEGRRCQDGNISKGSLATGAEEFCRKNYWLYGIRKIRLVKVVKESEQAVYRMLKKQTEIANLDAMKAGGDKNT